MTLWYRIRTAFIVALEILRSGSVCFNVRFVDGVPLPRNMKRHGKLFNCTIETSREPIAIAVIEDDHGVLDRSKLN